jgi:5S rRNA maturation endonuclease (ribonuclease M5)
MFTTHDHEKLISKLQHFSIIVEGKRDEKALKLLNLQDIIPISGKSLEEFMQSLPKNTEYVVLTDFDREGELKKRRIYRFFEAERIKYHPELRGEFKKLFKVVKIEELNKRGDVQYGKDSSIYDKILNRSKFHRRRRG